SPGASGARRTSGSRGAKIGTAIRRTAHFRAPPMASIVRLGDDVSFQIIACGDEMMPAAMRSAYGGAHRRVSPHQHDCARDGFSAARFIKKVLEDFDHPRFDPNRGSDSFATQT